MSVIERAAAAALLMAGLCGCATAMSLTEHERQNKIFSGTIKHVELQCAHGVCLDFPFSLVADAVLLPITVPWSIVNWTRPAGDRPASGAIEQREGRE